MQLLIHRRAEIAFRSLQKLEQKKISSAFNELFATDRAVLFKNPKFYIIASGFSGKKIFGFKGSSKLRLVLSFDNDTCTVEDIVNHDRLERLIAKGGQV